MSLHIELPVVNDDHVQKIKDKLYYAGCDEFSGMKLSFYKDELQEAADKMDDGDWKRWDLRSYEVWDIVSEIAKDRFIDEDVWETQVDPTNVDRYNKAINNTVFDVAWELAEDLCVFLGVPRHGEE